MSEDIAIPDQTVVARGGVITHVGPDSSVSVDYRALRIDGAGRFLIPGLADMHVHFPHAAFDEAYSTLFAAAGVTTVRNMSGTPRILALRDRIERAEIVGPRIFSTGPITDGSPSVYPQSRIVETDEQAESAAAADFAAGYDSIKVYSQLSPVAYQALIRAAHARGLKVSGHVPLAVTLDEALELRHDCNEHLTGFAGALQASDSPYGSGRASGLGDFNAMHGFIDMRKAAEVARKIANAGVWNCVTLVVTSKYVPDAEAIALLNAPEMQYMPPAVLAAWNPARDPRRLSATADTYRLARARFAANVAITSALREAGAKVLCGTDTPSTLVVPGFSVADELAYLVDAGLSPYGALRSATADAAEFLGRGGEFGTIAPGGRADLVLLDGNPLEDIRNVRRRAGVMLNGRWYPGAEIQALLDQLKNSYAAAH